MPDQPTPTSPYADLVAYLDVPRTSGLALSHDGTRRVTTVATLAPTAPAGSAPCGRSTRPVRVLRTG